MPGPGGWGCSSDFSCTAEKSPRFRGSLLSLSLRGGQAAVTSSVLFERPVGLLALGGLFACVLCDRVYKVIFSKALHVRTLYVLGQEYVPVVSLAHDIANAEFLGWDSWTHR